MRLIKPSYKIIEQELGINGVYKMIEYAGRVCYKSENKITEGSAKPFVDRMIKSQHYAMLEHGTVYLECPENVFQKYINNKYSRYKYIKEDIQAPEEYSSSLYYHQSNEYFYVTTNLRVLVENNWLDDLKYLCEPTEYHEKRYTVKFICDRGVSHKKFVA